MNNDFRDEIFVAVFERTIKRLWILCIVLILLLAGSNLAWIYHESQFEDVVTTETIEAEQNTEGGGNNIVVGGDYGTSESENDTDNQNEN